MTRSGRMKTKSVRVLIACVSIFVYLGLIAAGGASSGFSCAKVGECCGPSACRHDHDRATGAVLCTHMAGLSEVSDVSNCSAGCGCTLGGIGSRSNEAFTVNSRAHSGGVQEERPGLHPSLTSLIQNNSNTSSIEIIPVGLPSTTNTIRSVCLLM